MNSLPPPLRLVLSGYYGHGNVGDEAILAGIVTAIRSLAPDAHLTVISASPADTMEQHPVEAISHRGLIGIARAIRASDGLVSGGGSLLHDRTSQRPVPYYGGTILLARLLGRPAMVYAQGLGPLRRRHQRWLAALALRAADYLSLRDDRSVVLLRELGVHRPAVVVSDPVLGLPTPVSVASPGRPRLVVSLRTWPGPEGWVTHVVGALRQLSARFEIDLMPMHLPEDVAVAERVAAELGGAARVVVPRGYRAAIDVVAGADLVIGMRLHALIFAALAGRPFVAIAYDPKVTAFAEQLGQPLGADVTDEAFSGPSLASLVEAHLSADHAAYRRRAAALREAATRPAIAITDRRR